MVTEFAPRITYQERTVRGWCGPACLSMALDSVGIGIDQITLARISPYDPTWGTDYQAMLNGARVFVPESFSIPNSRVEELVKLIPYGAIIVNFTDPDPSVDHLPPTGEDGHYSLLEFLDSDTVGVVDPNPLVFGGGHRRIKRDWFKSHFFDIDRQGQVVSGWSLFIPR